MPFIFSRSKFFNLFFFWGGSHSCTVGQGGDTTRSYFQGQRPDTKMSLEKQSNSDTRSQRNEDMDIGYEENPAVQTFQSLEEKVHDDIMKLIKEQNDAEDAENARHREVSFDLYAFSSASS